MAEKTSSNITAADTLLTLFPDALFVHMVRDGRDVLASHREVQSRLRHSGMPYNKANFRPRGVCGRWNRSVDSHFKLVQDPALTGRYRCVRYEELLLDPHRVLESLFEFFSLDLEPRALEPQTIPANEVGMVVDGYWITEAKDRVGFDPSRIHRWRRDLSPADAALSNLLMRSRLRALGYTRRGNGLGG